LQASRLKVTQIILIKIFLITDHQKHEFEKKVQPSDSKFEFTWGVANWCRLVYELSIVNITTDV